MLAIGIYNIYKDKVGELVPEKPEGEGALNYENVLEVPKQPNRLMGIVGAVLGTLIGVVLWAVVGALGYISGWMGYLMIVFAQIGYRMFSGANDKFGSVVSVICCAIAVVPATFLGSAWGYYTALNEHMPGYYNLIQAMKMYPGYLVDSGNIASFGINVAIGYVFMIVSFLRRA